ncbi:MAG: heparinase II/III-family protein [Opitutaceae bacterium]|jgi:hypothetical protein|nr:heparinase II/III-family protein [Opitutaceae bacterium]
MTHNTRPALTTPGNKPAPATTLATALATALTIATVTTLTAKPIPKPDPDRVTQITAWLREQDARRATPVFWAPPFADQTWWDDAARALAGPLDTLLAQADNELTRPPPELTQALFDTFKETGQRAPYEKPFERRTTRLGYFLYAQGLSRHHPRTRDRPRDHYLAAIETELAAILDEPTWALPPHAASRPGWLHARDIIDLGAAHRAWNLALADYLLADQLKPATRARIRAEIRDRLITPYLASVRAGDSLDSWWMHTGHNWNAICNAGVLAAALLLADPLPPLLPPGGATLAERAEILASFETNTNAFFIAGLGDDGYCHEGIGYWIYGYGHYMLGAELVRLATGGAIDPLTLEKQRRIAAFGSRWRMAPGLYPQFGDTFHDKTIPAWMNDFATLRHHGDGGLMGLSPRILYQHPMGDFLYATAMDLSLPRPAPGTPEARAIENRRATLAPRDWFPDGGALVVRSHPPAPDAPPLSAAFKGGHNDQPHNHNDLGSFEIALGSQTLLPDLGADDYVKDTFSPRRYTSAVMNSLGHAVPRVAGKLQRHARDARAETLRIEFSDTRDLWEIDITSAYLPDAPALEKLTRTFIFTRPCPDAPAGRVEIIDRVRFHKNQPATFGTALIIPLRQTLHPLPAPDRRTTNPAAGFRIHAATGDHALDVTWKAVADGRDTRLARLEEPVIGIDPGRGSKGTRLGLDLPAPVVTATLHTIIIPVSVRP